MTKVVNWFGQAWKSPLGVDYEIDDNGPLVKPVKSGY